MRGLDWIDLICAAAIRYSQSTLMKSGKCFALVVSAIHSFMHQSINKQQQRQCISTLCTWMYLQKERTRVVRTTTTLFVADVATRESIVDKRCRLMLLLLLVILLVECTVVISLHCAAVV